MANDFRVRMTQNLIKESFLELLEQKPLRTITVKELAAKAHINRATFYAHYENIYTLLDDIKSEFVSGLMGSIDAFTNDDSIEELFRTICRYAADHLKHCRLLFGKNGDFGLASHIVELVRPRTIALWKEAGGRDEEKLNYHYTFVAYGGLAVIRDWVQSGAHQSPEYIADFIVQNGKKDILQY